MGKSYGVGNPWSSEIVSVGGTSAPRGVSDAFACSKQGRGDRYFDPETDTAQILRARDLYKKIYRLKGWYVINGEQEEWGKYSLCGVLGMSLHGLKWNLGMMTHPDESQSEEITKPRYGKWWGTLLGTSAGALRNHRYKEEITQIQSLAMNHKRLGMSTFGKNSYWVRFGAETMGTPDSVGKAFKLSQKVRSATEAAFRRPPSSSTRSRGPLPPTAVMDSPAAGSSPPTNSGEMPGPSSPLSSPHRPSKRARLSNENPDIDSRAPLPDPDPETESGTTELYFEELSGVVSINSRRRQVIDDEIKEYTKYLKKRQAQREALPHNRQAGNTGIAAWVTREGLIDDSDLRPGSDRARIMYEMMPTLFAQCLELRMGKREEREYGRTQRAIERVVSPLVEQTPPL